MYELGTKRSTIRDLFEYGKEQAKIVGAENVFDFSIGNPTVPAPECIKEAMLDLLQNEKSDVLHGYTSAQGNLDLREALANYMNKEHASKLKADNFYITCGAAASLCISIKALISSPSDEFIIIAPFFPEYTVFIEHMGGKFIIVEADTDNFQIKMEALAKAFSKNTKGIIINSPNNPSGVVYSEETLKALGALLRKKSKEYNKPIYLISDEPYREIVYDNIKVPFVPSFYDNTIICYSYSKSLSLPGERIGYILVPDKVTPSKELYTAVCGAGRSLGYVCAPSLFQKVVLKCLGKTSDVNIYDINRKLLYNKLSELGYDCVNPNGAFYLFVKALEENSINFSENAKKLNLLIVPADDFGCPGYVRISYCVNEDMIRRSFSAFEKLKTLYSGEQCK